MPYKKKTFRKKTKKTVDKKQDKRISRIEKIVKPEIKDHVQPWAISFDGTDTIQYATSQYRPGYVPTASAETKIEVMTPIISVLSNAWVETLPGGGLGTSTPVNARHYAVAINQIEQGDGGSTRDGRELYMMGLSCPFIIQNESKTPASFNQVIHFRWILTYDKSQRGDLVGEMLDPLTNPAPLASYSQLVVNSSQLRGCKSVKTMKRPLVVLADTGAQAVHPRTTDSVGGKWFYRGRFTKRIARNTTFFDTTAESIYSGSLNLHLYISSNDDNIPFGTYAEPCLYYLDN